MYAFMLYMYRMYHEDMTNANSFVQFNMFNNFFLIFKTFFYFLLCKVKNL